MWYRIVFKFIEPCRKSNMIFFTQEKALCYPDIYNSVHQPTAIEWIHDIHVLIFPAAARRRQGGRLTRPHNDMKSPRGRNYARVTSDARIVSPPFGCSVRRVCRGWRTSQNPSAATPFAVCLSLQIEAQHGPRVQATSWSPSCAMSFFKTHDFACFLSNA